jgi:CRP/FNR family cyclic AMP-dependent transcriptional regulator
VSHDVHPHAGAGSVGATERAWAASFLARFPTKVQNDLRASALPMTIAPDHIIYRAHDHPRFVLLVSGLARIVTSSPDGRKATIRYARAADCVGAVSVVTDWQEVMAEAVTAAEVLFLNVDRLRHFARTEPEVGWLLAQAVGKVCTEVIDMMSSTVFGSVRQRLARHLLDLAVRRGNELLVLQDQQEMADAIGSVREVVGRTIRDLRERGMVSRAGAGLRLDDPDGIHSLSLDG